MYVITLDAFQGNLVPRESITFHNGKLNVTVP